VNDSIAADAAVGPRRFWSVTWRAAAETPRLFFSPITWLWRAIQRRLRPHAAGPESETGTERPHILVQESEAKFRVLIHGVRLRVYCEADFKSGRGAGVSTAEIIRAINEARGLLSPPVVHRLKIERAETTSEQAARERDRLTDLGTRLFDAMAKQFGIDSPARTENHVTAARHDEPDK
jgi:hypothetical protein